MLTLETDERFICVFDNVARNEKQQKTEAYTGFMVQKFTSEFRCEIFVLRRKRRVSNYFVSIIMACELGEGGVLIVTLMRGWKIRGF